MGARSPISGPENLNGTTGNVMTPEQCLLLVMVLAVGIVLWVLRDY